MKEQRNCGKSGLKREAQWESVGDRREKSPTRQESVDVGRIRRGRTGERNVYMKGLGDGEQAKGTRTR